MFSGLLPIDLFKGGLGLEESFFSQSYGHTCHTRFAVFFSSCPVAQAHNLFTSNLGKNKIKLNVALRSSLKLV